MVRQLIDDTVEGSYQYSDERLIALIYVAAMHVNSDISGSYSISACNQTISPDPSDSFIILTAKKAACMLARGVYKSYTINGAKITDGPTTVDLTAGIKEFANIVSDLCSDYERTLTKYLIEGTTGYVLSTPNSES